MHSTSFVGLALTIILIALPALLTVVGLVLTMRRRASAQGGGTRPPWEPRLSLCSTLLYTLAFNLIFFIQEVFLVLPKALTPGLRPVLFHNNHTWFGSHPLERLFQGAGALAILLAGLVAAVWLSRRKSGSWAVQLFLIWMAYHGLIQALPQLPVGSVEPRTDVGVALDYLGTGTALETVLSLAALAAAAAASVWLGRHILRLAETPQETRSIGDRQLYLLRVASGPAFVAILLIIPFRIPGDFGRVLMPQVMAALIGMLWMHGSLWWREAPPVAGFAKSAPIKLAAALLLALLLFFQLVLRPGLAFF